MRRSPNFTAAILCIIVMTAAGANGLGAQSQQQSTVAKWGSYTVVRTPNPVYSGLYSKLTVLSPQRTVVLTVTADRITDTLFIFDRHRPSDLLVHAWSICTDQGRGVSLVFSRTHGVHNCGVMRGAWVVPGAERRTGPANLEDTDSPVFEWSSNYSNASSPSNIRILYAWNGRYYAEDTRQFQQPSILTAKKYARLFLLNQRHDGLSEHTPADVMTTKSIRYLGSYYGNMAMIGQSVQAKAWIEKHAMTVFQSWFAMSQSDFDSRVNIARRTGYLSSQVTYNGSTMMNPWDDDSDN